jgi:hypothetical protein
MSQLVQVLGSLLILAAFIAAQRGRLSPESRLYLALNLAGASVLAVLAAREHQFGFLMLESVWALVAAHSLLRGWRADAGVAPDGNGSGSSRPSSVGATEGGHARGRAA